MASSEVAPSFEREGVLSIGALYDEVEHAIERAFPRSRPLWVRGEIQQLSDRTGHCYLDLVDPDDGSDRQAPALKVKCWRRTWASLKGSLRREGIELEPGMVVVLRGHLDLYRPKAELGFILSELDVTALLGRLAADRAALIRALRAEGLLARNSRLSLVGVPLRLGLVASPGTEGDRDFLGQLSGSGYSFRVVRRDAVVQGPDAPASIAAALADLADEELDLVVMVRGGGSRADLAPFDSEAVARAIAGMPVPVWTGVGHTGDQSVADLVAHRSWITPTACGREVVLTVERWWDSAVSRPVGLIGQAATLALEEAESETTAARTRMAMAARHQLRWHRERLSGRVATIRSRGPHVLDTAQWSLTGRADRLAPRTAGHLHRAEERLGSWRRLLAAYDVDRQLERGYTLTMDEDGRPVRRAAAVGPGTVLTTRFVDGSVRSVVDRATVETPHLLPGARRS